MLLSGRKLKLTNSVTIHSFCDRSAASFSSMKSASFLLLCVMGLSVAKEHIGMAACLEDEACSTLILSQVDLEKIRNEVKRIMEKFVAQRDVPSDCQINIGTLKKKIQLLKKDYNRILSKDVPETSPQEGFDDEKRLTPSFNFPVDCADILAKGPAADGIYSIYPSKGGPIKVWCDMTSSGGGWTVFFTRKPQAEPLDFNESWENFKNGFGNISSEYWLGNDLLHDLASLGPSALRVDAKNFTNSSRWAEWNNFEVADEFNKYQLTLEDYVEGSTLGDSLSDINKSFFTTKDNDNDKTPILNCAVGMKSLEYGKGGWWYRECGNSRPTAPLRNSDGWDSACWHTWDRNATSTNCTSLQVLCMKIRRHNYQQFAMCRKM